MHPRDVDEPLGGDELQMSPEGSENWMREVSHLWHIFKKWKLCRHRQLAHSFPWAEALMEMSTCIKAQNNVESFYMLEYIRASFYFIQEDPGTYFLNADLNRLFKIQVSFNF